MAITNQKEMSLQMALRLGADQGQPALLEESAGRIYQVQLVLEVVLHLFRLLQVVLETQEGQSSVSPCYCLLRILNF